MLTQVSKMSTTPTTNIQSQAIVSGYFKQLNEFNQMILSISEEENSKLTELTKHLEGKSPLSSFISLHDSKTKYTLKVALNNRDKSVHRYFSKIAQRCGSSVQISVNIKSYDFENDKGERINGWKCILSSMANAAKKEE